MASPNLTGEQVLALAAARLNNPTQSVYTNEVLLPFLNLSLLDLQQIYEENNVPVTDQTSAVIEVDAAPSGIIEIGFAPDPPIVDTPYLPNDLIEIKVAWQSGRGLNEWVRFSPVDYLPQYQLGAQVSSFVNYQWATNCMKLLAANADNDIKLDYVRSLFRFLTIDDLDDDLLVINAHSYLSNRTASYAAHDIEENEQRSIDLQTDANASLDQALAIATKGRQKIQIRRMPFRSGYKSRHSLVS